MAIESLTTSCYRIPLEPPLSDSTHGILTSFQLITVVITDTDGARGLGYVYTVGHGGVAIRSIIERDLRPILLNQDAEQIDDHWHSMWSRLHYVGRGGMASFAISAVDIALWDLRARRLEKPLWQVLGASDPRVPTYAGGIDLRLPTDSLLRQTEANLEKGFRAIKMKIGREDLDEDVQRVADMRKLLGHDIPLMADANMIWSIDQAITASRRLEPYGLYWLEEPIAPDDFAGHATIIAETNTPIAAGENLHTAREFEFLIQSNVQFPEPDVANIGGFTTWLQIARMAEAAGLPVTSHGVHDLHVHLLAAVPNRSYLECHGFGINQFMKEQLVIEDGHAIAPDRPGHGVDLLWNELKEFEED